MWLAQFTAELLGLKIALITKARVSKPNAAAWRFKYSNMVAHFPTCPIHSSLATFAAQGKEPNYIWYNYLYNHSSIVWSTLYNNIQVSIRQYFALDRENINLVWDIKDVYYRFNHLDSLKQIFSGGMQPFIRAAVVNQQQQ